MASGIFFFRKRLLKKDIVKSLVQNKVRKVVLFTEKKEDELQMTHLFVIACVIGTKFASD
jgi:hypothetical protein